MIPAFGQIAKSDLESTPKEEGAILEDDVPRFNFPKYTGVFFPQPRAVSSDTFDNSVFIIFIFACVSTTDILTGEASREDVHVGDSSPITSHLGDVSPLGSIGEVLLEDATLTLLYFTGEECRDATHLGTEVKAPDPREE